MFGNRQKRGLSNDEIWAILHKMMPQLLKQAKGVSRETMWLRPRHLHRPPLMRAASSFEVTPPLSPLPPSIPPPPPIIDYEGSHYRTDFWEGQGREYEDLAERAALRRLLPPQGHTLLEAGAGFGRLASLYAGYRRVILVDYSLSLLQEARQLWGHDDRFVFVAASIYAMPFADNLVDALVMVRVMHHLHSPALALDEIARIVQGGKVFVLEYANKRNLKSMARYALRRQSWSPFDHQPYEFVQLNYDFHPAWMDRRLRQAGFGKERELAISSFRLPALKSRVPAPWLARLDGVLAAPAAALKLAPSVMVRCRNHKPAGPCTELFRCPTCGGAGLAPAEPGLRCQGCGAGWPQVDGVYDFRSAVSRETATS